MEPHLIIFEEDDTIVQVFIAGEDDNLMELPVISIGEGIVYLMAVYYVFSVEYPNPYKPLLFFFQDFIMDIERTMAKGQPDMPHLPPQ